MNIYSKSFETVRRCDMVGKSITSYSETDSKLSKTMINKLIKYALNRLDEDIKELITLKNYKVVVNQLGDRSQRLNDFTYQVDFISNSGLMFSIDGILLNNKNIPCIDHGISIAENQ